MKWLALGVVALAALAAAVVVGPAGFSSDQVTLAIIRDLRVPRALLAFLVGGSLAVTGAALQALVRNPLADPYLLGLSGGAGLGAAAGVGGRAGGTRGAVPGPPGIVVRTPGPARGGRRRGAPAAGRGRTVKWVALALVAIGAVTSALTLGSAAIPLRDLAGSGILWDLRAPRAALGFLVGGSLAVAGAALQAVVRNPLADPFLLGLSGGAALGAVSAIAFQVAGPWAVPLAAFAGALLALALVYRMALAGGGVLDPRVLLLGGVAVGAFAAAITTAVVSLAQATELRNAFLWLWGGLSGASWDTVLVLTVYAPVPLVAIAASARPLDLLSLGEEPATYLGADVERVKRRVYLAASLLTAAAVAVSGVIGFVGLIVPHAGRLVWGHRHRALLPAVFLAGGALVVLADTVARTAAAPREVPVGIVTALLGVPLFVLLLRRWTIA